MTAEDYTKIVFREAERQGISRVQLSKKSGICYATLRSWYYKQTTPSLSYLLPVLEALGLQLTITRKNDAK